MPQFFTGKVRMTTTEKEQNWSEMWGNPQQCSFLFFVFPVNQLQSRRRSVGKENGYTRPTTTCRGTSPHTHTESQWASPVLLAPPHETNNPEKTLNLFWLLCEFIFITITDRPQNFFFPSCHYLPNSQESIKSSGSVCSSKNSLWLLNSPLIETQWKHQKYVWEK